MNVGLFLFVLEKTYYYSKGFSENLLLLKAVKQPLFLGDYVKYKYPTVNFVLSSNRVKAYSNTFSDIHKQAALLILADAVASYSESEYQENRSDETKEMMREFVRPQEDILDTVPSAAESYGIDIEKFLPMNVVEEMEESMKKKWGFTFEELADKISEDCVYAAVMGMLGHGVNAWDDYAKELNALGITKDKRLGYFDYGVAYDEAIELYEAIKAAKSE